MPSPTPPSLYLPFGFDSDYSMKGEFLFAAAKFPSEMYIPLSFVTNECVSTPNPKGWTEVNMVIVPEITVECMETAVGALDYKDWVCCCYAYTESEVRQCVEKRDWPPRPPSRNGWPPERFAL